MRETENSELRAVPSGAEPRPCLGNSGEDSRQMFVTVTPGGQGEHPGGWSETVSKVLTGPLVWALLFAFLAFRLRSPLNRLIDALRKRVEDGDDLDVLGVKVSKKEFHVDSPVGVKVEEKIVSKGVDME